MSDAILGMSQLAEVAPICGLGPLQSITHLQVTTMRKAGDVYDPSCSARDALALIASKWSMLILPALEPGPMRNAQLKRKIGGISQKVLTQTLRELERNGLIVRTDLRTRPRHVEYRLSRLGNSLSRTLKVLDRWAERHFPSLDAARARYDASRERLGR